MPSFKTTEAYLSGAVCGNLWMPDALAGKPIRANLRGTWGFMPEGDGWTFRDALDSLLMREGGDFQSAKFSADTEIVILRRAIDAPGKYRIHAKRLEVAKLAPDMVREDAYSCDFFGDD